MKTNTSKLWNDKASVYSKMASSKEADAYEYEINFPSILSLCPTEAKNVLDLGCGAGGFTEILSYKYKGVIGADVSPNMIDLAKQKLPHMEFVVADLEQRFPTFKEKFDLVIMKLVVMFVEDLENVAKETSAITPEGGNVILSVPHPFYWASEYLKDKFKYSKRPEFRVLKEGYFTQIPIEKPIGGDKELTFGFIHRTLSTYINAFSKYGLLVEKIDEPKITQEFVTKYPKYNDKLDIPMRLNVCFKKTQS